MDFGTEAAHVALMRDDWRLVPAAIRLGRRTFTTIQQNRALAILHNVMGIGLAAIEWLPPVWAAAAQSLPDVVILLNSLRFLGRGQTPVGFVGIIPRWVWASP
jgi:Cu+-exporting ATPase